MSVKKEPPRTLDADQKRKKPPKKKNKPDSLDRLARFVKRILKVPASDTKTKK